MYGARACAARFRGVHVRFRVCAVRTVRARKVYRFVSYYLRLQRSSFDLFSDKDNASDNNWGEWRAVDDRRIQVTRLHSLIN